MGGADIISGGAGKHDRIAFDWAPAGVYVRVALRAAAQGTEFLSGLEDVLGSPFADLIRGGDVANLLRGGSGHDDLRGGGGDDFINARDGGPGDVLHGGSGKNTCRFDHGDSVHGC
jgi:Ca2+-binding RTX toxin-like protein